MFTTSMPPVNTMLCQPQLQSATSCDGQVCSWSVELPCTPDAGAPVDGGAGSDAGDDANTDGGAEPSCATLCGAVTPAGAPPFMGGFCQFDKTTDGAWLARCGGCGI
jgi:hypothetical protein